MKHKTRVEVVEAAACVLAGHRDLPHRDDQSDALLGLMSDIGTALERAAALPVEVTSATDLAAWNDAQQWLEWMSDGLLGGDVREDIEVLDALHGEIESLLHHVSHANTHEHGPESAKALLVQALWNKVTDQRMLTPAVLSSALFAATEAAADSILSGDRVLVKLEDPQLTSKDGWALNAAFAIAPGSDVLLLPAGALLALEGRMAEVVPVGGPANITPRRLEALAALVGDDGATLADLWDATSEL